MLNNTITQQIFFHMYKKGVLITSHSNLDRNSQVMLVPLNIVILPTAGGGRAVWGHKCASVPSTSALTHRDRERTINAR